MIRIVMPSRILVTRGPFVTYLGLPFQVVNFAKEYWDRVFQHCLDEFAAGRTPESDIWCNKEIKFKVFLEHVLKIGDALGYWTLCANQHIDETAQLLKGADGAKDRKLFSVYLGPIRAKSFLISGRSFAETPICGSAWGKYQKTS